MVDMEVLNLSTFDSQAAYASFRPLSTLALGNQPRSLLGAAAEGPREGSAKAAREGGAGAAGEDINDQLRALGLGVGLERSGSVGGGAGASSSDAIDLDSSPSSSSSSSSSSVSSSLQHGVLQQGVRLVQSQCVPAKEVHERILDHLECQVRRGERSICRGEKGSGQRALYPGTHSMLNTIVRFECCTCIVCLFNLFVRVSSNSWTPRVAVGRSTWR